MPAIPAGPDKFLTTMTASAAAAKPGTIVNATELTKAIGATWRIVERWMAQDAAIPVLTRGGQGEPWRFDLVATLAYLIEQGQGVASDRAARKADTARMAGFGGSAGPAPVAPAGPGAAAAATYDARALKALADAQMVTHKLKQQQGQYIPAAAVQTLLADMMTTMQTETLAVSASLDPAGQWPADLRVDVEDSLRTILVTVRDRMDRRLREWARNGAP